MSSPAVAVIDIGSNSIKVLVAARGSDGRPVGLDARTLDARISAGIGRNRSRLTDEGMARGVAAVRDLLAGAAAHRPVRTQLVATSAVRDAENGADFRGRVRAATGHDIRILTGDEEALAIGRGLLTDPELAGLDEFQVFDLGGGSLECLAFRDRNVAQAASLPLGCVRLTEMFVPDTAAPFTPEAHEAIRRHVLATLADGPFRAGDAAAAVATGGTAATVRAVLGAPLGRTAEEMPATIQVGELENMLRSLGALDLASRRRVPGLPPARADIFPTALATILAVAEAGRFDSFRHSFRNLRWGIAADLLAEMR